MWVRPYVRLRVGQNDILPFPQRQDAILPYIRNTMGR